MKEKGFELTRPPIPIGFFQTSDLFLCLFLVLCFVSLALVWFLGGARCVCGFAVQKVRIRVLGCAGKISARELADSGRQIGEVFVVGDRKLILTLQYPFIRAQNPLDSVRWWPVLFSFYLKGPAPRGKVA